ncbi:MAG: hypothetical protein EOO96_15120 [Pedobacter sp.]|nr:MAG: hypothetical protein EOO96_15120 [Pedobacter sp.]
MESPGKIFLADQRGFVQSTILRRYSTFNFEQYFNDNSMPFGDLFLFNDDSISGGKLTFFLSKEDSYQIFMPVTGGLDIVFNGKEYALQTGQVQIFNVGKGEVLEISNPYQNDAVNYIQIGLKTDLFLLRHSKMLFNFDFEKDKNKLIEIVSNPKLAFNLSAGIFGAKAETTYSLRSAESNAFLFVIDGAFETSGRLMHARDGLALWETETVKFQALSNNAIVMVLEMLEPGF